VEGVWDYGQAVRKIQRFQDSKIQKFKDSKDLKIQGFNEKRGQDVEACPFFLVTKNK
jgi:hypothetical protein